MTALDRVKPPREGDVDGRPLEPLCESPSMDADVAPLRDRVDAMILVPVPETMSSTVSSVPNPVPVLVSVVVRPLVNEDDE